MGKLTNYHHSNALELITIRTPYTISATTKLAHIHLFIYCVYIRVCVQHTHTHSTLETYPRATNYTDFELEYGFVRINVYKINTHILR